MAKEFSLETSNLIIVQNDGTDNWGGMWAVFDVSQTNERHFIACHWEKEHPNESIWTPDVMVYVFEGIRDLLTWCGDIQGEMDVVFRAGIDSKFNDEEWLDEECRNDGWDSWKVFLQNR